MRSRSVDSHAGAVESEVGDGIAAASLAIAFGSVDLANVVSFTLPHNWASRRVIEKLGFAYERPGVPPLRRTGLSFRGNLRDDLVV